MEILFIFSQLSLDNYICTLPLFLLYCVFVRHRAPYSSKHYVKLLLIFIEKERDDKNAHQLAQ